MEPVAVTTVDGGRDAAQPPARRPPVSRRKVARPRLWLGERVVFTGDEYFAALIEDIGRARVSIDLESYIFEDDDVGRRVCVALAAAADRGVVVRLLVDGVGSASWVRRQSHTLQRARLSVRVYHPLPWLLFSRPTHGGIGFGRLFRMALRLNRRNHRKTCLIDGRAAWVGSANVSACHSRGSRGCDAWRDTVARVEGEAVAELERAFSYTWRRSWRLTRRQMRPPLVWRGRKAGVVSGLVRLNNKHRSRRRLYRELTARIAAAARRVWITNAYFVPNGRLVAALAKAVANGADVRVLVPSKSDVVFMPWVSAAFYVALLRKGVRIFEYQPSVLHAKTMIVDEWVTVGTTNLNDRSLLHDLEADVVLLQPGSRAALERAFADDIGESHEIGLTAWRARPWLARNLGWLALRARYWL